MTYGSVFLVGAGPGDPGLITWRGLDLLRRAEVVIYDRLIGPELLAETAPTALLIDVGKASGEHPVPQDQIHRLLVSHAQEGKCVVRLKGGDPFVFGRGFEELTACHAAGVPCTVVPGVSSAIAGPALAGIPITHRQWVRGFAVVTARAPHDSTAPELDFRALAALDTVIVLMGREALPEFTQKLMEAGRDASTPAACIEQATTQRQRTVCAPLVSLVGAVERAGLRAPIVTVIGKVASYARSSGDLYEAVPAPLSLWGKRIVITRPRNSAGVLRKLLRRAGAVPLTCPLLRTAPPLTSAKLDEAIEQLASYDWLLFTSPNAVRAMFRRLAVLRRDTRALAGIKIGAVGPGTADVLRKMGIQADLVPDKATGRGLAEAIVSHFGTPPRRALLPCSDLARPELADALRAAGGQVDDVVAYRTLAIRPRPIELNLLRHAADAIVFCSPSAVRQFRTLEIDVRGAAIACIGSTTAEAVRQAGLNPSIIADRPTATDLVMQLQAYFAGRSPTG